MRAVKGPALNFFEQPVAADNLSGMAQVAAATDIEVGADEGIHSLEDIKRHRERNAARRQPEGDQTGQDYGACRGRNIVRATQHECKHFLQDWRIEHCLRRRIASAASVLPDIAWALTLTHTGLVEDISTAPVVTANGHVDVLNRPGLGVDVDEDCVRSYRVAVAVRNVA
jgi:L-alanine-DL-glutamate epimerase-like enolase superfamily enzyme